MSRSAPPAVGDAAVLPRDIAATRALALLDAASDIALLLDPAGTVLQVRARDRELLKTARRAWLGKPWADIVTVESRDKVAELLAGALGDAPTPPRQVNHQASTGPDLPILYTAVRLGGARGAERVVAAGRDLRDTVMLQRRLVEAQQSMERDYWRFREAETRYRNLFQASSEAVLIVDGRSQRVIEANPAAQTLLGRGGKPGKVVDAPLASLFDADAAEPLAAAVASARSVGRHERLAATLAASALAVAVSLASFRQDEASFLLVRLAPVAASEPAAAGGRGKAGGRAASTSSLDAPSRGLEAAFVRQAADALAFTDTTGRVVGVNRAFARLAQLSSEDQARGAPLDRWLGRTGVELSVLMTNLRDQPGGGSAGLFTTELRGSLGLVTEVEIAASALEGADGAAYAFAVRDVGRRLAPREGRLETKVPTSVAQLTELVGRVPLKQIVAETSDLIERLSIETALTMTRDNRAMAAQLLGLSRQSLYVKLRRFGLGGLEDGAGDG